MNTNPNIVPHQFKVSRRNREAMNGHRAILLWFTGLSGSGKSTIANAVEQLLHDKGLKTYILDGDNVRTGLNKGLGFTQDGRKENIRRIAEVSRLFIDAGTVVLSAFIAPLRSDRLMVKEIVGDTDYVEVFINTPLAECERRDVKGLYQKARAGEITHFTGVSAPYEVPEQPDIEIDTANQNVDDAAQHIVNYLVNTLKIQI